MDITAPQEVHSNMSHSKLDSLVSVSTIQTMALYVPL